MYAYGIDLGTTYSCIARADENGLIEVLKNKEGKNITPSVVEFESSNNIVVGEVAKGDSVLNSENVVAFIMRDMGHPEKERTFFGTSYPPEQISSFILGKLCGDVSAAMGEEVKDVVITVPAYFGQEQREATKNAGKIAGLNVLAIVNEPTAAALCYEAESKGADRKILVYDLGGGTFDITVAEIVGGKVNVICTNGDHNLGGKDWDETLANYIIRQFCDETSADEDEVRGDSELMSDLRVKTEEAKKRLSSNSATSIPLALDRNTKAKIEITREKFDEITRPHLLMTKSLTDKVLEEATAKGVTKDQISQIMLVGGSTRMPQVKEMLGKEYSSFELSSALDPDESVARGAAALAIYIKAHPDEPEKPSAGGGSAGGLPPSKKDGALPSFAAKKFSEVTSKSYGIVVIGNDDKEIISNIILRNTAIPGSESRSYNPYEDGQTNIVLRIVESNVSENTADISFGKELGEGHIEFPAPAKRTENIEVTFAIDSNGVLTMTARAIEQQRDCVVTIEVGGLSDTQVDLLKKSSSAIRIS